MSGDLRIELQSMVNNASDEHWGYFCYEDYWCDSADQDREPCECTDEDCMIGYPCECGDCEAHHGSLLEVKITRDADGDLRGVIATIAVGGPRIELDTGRQQVIGYWGKEVARARVNIDTCERVNQFFDELGM